jgi:hypothetical protein
MPLDRASVVEGGMMLDGRSFWAFPVETAACLVTGSCRGCQSLTESGVAWLCN